MKKILVCFLFVLFSGIVQADTYDDLLKAVKIGDISRVTALLQLGVDPDTTDIEGNTLLMIAAREGHEPLVELLLTQRPKLNARNSAGDNALRLAAIGGRTGIVKKLVAAGARINTPDWTPLIYACFGNHVEIVRYLIQMKADVNAASDNGTTALMVASSQGQAEIVRLLLGAGADPNKMRDNGETALDMALKTRNEEIAGLLRAQGGKPGKSR
ncbi:MAG: Ankyrin repeats (3 copies) [Betaproteobacteria bacterium ADurb.Bin341]|nr:MAG: Ankyrin repeats (3 copies) [Betaproteobacteria bacterium ADurb.Bin341]